MIRIVLLGAGNVAYHLYKVLAYQENVEIIQCFNRKNVTLSNDQDPKMVTNSFAEIKEADLYILAVSDDAIAEVSQKLPFQNRLVVHTSGSAPMNIIHTKQRSGVFYPLQTFSKSKKLDFSMVPICLEAQHSDDLEVLQNLASKLSTKTYEINSQQRSTLHIAAVFVNNFTNYMFTAGKNICDNHKVPFEILHPLIIETAQKATQIDPSSAQTGPAVRNDQKTIKRHLDSMSNNTYKEIYQILTKAIINTYGKEL